jgi:O-methyltransferase
MTLGGVRNEIFAFVSIDADLYLPIYEGLCFFYERLAHNGYILVHDFNNSFYSGAKKAVMDFCAEKNISYVPIADFHGSAVITKVIAKK